MEHTNKYYSAGNALDDSCVSDATSGWFIGQFMPSSAGMRATGDVEIKWGTHPCGEQKQSSGTNNRTTTLTLLISGEFRIALGEQPRIFILRNPGDYAIFAPGVRHHWAALTDSVVVTVRWPSLPLCPTDLAPFDIDEAIGLLTEICNENRSHDEEIMQGTEGERIHALDVLKNVTELAPGATLALRLAALFHDVDRIVTRGQGGGFQGDRNSDAYRRHKKEHAMRSVEFILPLLRRKCVPEDLVDRTGFLISHHDDQLDELIEIDDSDLNILVTADVLAFFTSIGPKLLAAEGRERARDKIAFMIGKLPPSARQLVSRFKCNDTILDELKDDALRAL